MEIPPESLPIFARQTLASFREPSVRLIVVIGAGIAGLTAARRLRSLQYGVIVVEARDRCIAIVIFHFNIINDGSQMVAVFSVTAMALISHRTISVILIGTQP